MKNRNIFLLILLASASLTLFGFMADSDEYIPDFKTNIIDFSVMTALFFCFFSLLFILWKIISKYLIRQL